MLQTTEGRSPTSSRSCGGIVLFWWGEATDEPTREDARPIKMACCPNHFGAGGARLSQPQHVRQTQSPWNFVRSSGNPSCCGWDTRAPFHLGYTPSTTTANDGRADLPSLLGTISRRRGELHETPFSKAFDELGARVTRPSDTSLRSFGLKFGRRGLSRRSTAETDSAALP
jgi:hypothetical protein